MKAPEYTDLQLMERVWDVEAVKKLAAKRAYYIANDWREKELDELWVTGEDAKKTASFCRNWGYYIGMDAIRDYYVTAHNEKLDACPGNTAATAVCSIIPSPPVLCRRPMTEKPLAVSGTASPRRPCPPPTPRPTPAGIWKSSPSTF